MSARRTPSAHKRLRVDDKRDIFRTAGAAGTGASRSNPEQRGIKPQRAEPSDRQRSDIPRGEAGDCGAGHTPPKNRREYPAQFRPPARAAVPRQCTGRIFRCRRSATTCRDRFRWSGVRSRRTFSASSPDRRPGGPSRRFRKGGSNPYSGARPEPSYPGTCRSATPEPSRRLPRRRVHRAEGRYIVSASCRRQSPMIPQAASRSIQARASCRATSGATS